jgi:hypothetical protein
MRALTADHFSADHDLQWDVLVRLWKETDAPKGCKVEIIDGVFSCLSLGSYE